MGLFSFFALILFFIPQAYSCQSANLYEIPDSPFLKIPIQIQKAGTCYAYSTAQLVNYELARSGYDFRNISPIWMAYAYTKIYETSSKNISGGHDNQTLKAIQKIGLCPPQTIEDAIRPYYKVLPPKGLIYAFEGILDRLEDKFENMNSCNGPKALFEDKLSDVSCRLHYLDVDKFTTDFGDILNKLDYMPILDKVFSECAKQTSALPYKKNGIKWDARSKPFKEFQSKSEELLKYSQKPFNISYCSNIYSDKDYKKDENCLHHSSVVVAQRMYNEKCQLLIRDSNVIYEKEDTQSHSLNPYEHYYDSQGNITGTWIDQESIWNNLESIFSLE